MGNSSTKEQRPSPGRLRSTDGHSNSSPAGSGPINPSHLSSLERPPSHPVYNVRTGRGSRPDLSSLLHIRSGPAPETIGPEGRRESKQEREARKLEKERNARAKERERSMREEHVDGGYLVTQGVYIGIEDYNKGVVRQLMIERRLAPFWRGLNDHSDSWTENQLVAVARGLPIPAPDEIPLEEESSLYPNGESELKTPSRNINNLTVPMSSRSQSFASDTSSNVSPSQSSFPPGPGLFTEASTSGSALFRGRAKTLASLTTSSKSPQGDITPREMQLPKDPFVNGQPIEAYLYKDASECPICFLFYPPYLNKTRCCDQAICSECFVQIKRPDPHPPEHADPTAPPPPPSEEGVDPEELVSEPAACPFCVQPEFGVTFDPPPFRRGLTYVNHPSTHPLANTSSAMSSESSLTSAMSNGGRMSPPIVSRRRTTSVSATSPSVITTDKIRPDWHQKLATARAHTARRSAAATALHTAAYLMGNRGQEGDGRAMGAFGRRGILRRTSGADSTSVNAQAQLNMLTLMSERYAASNAPRAEDGEPAMTPGARGSSRRSRVDDLEDMMMMEAIRLSLASEEDRRKREEKEAKKGAKKKEKETKKAEKVARKTGVYPSSANQSSAGIDSTSGEVSASHGDLSSFLGKGKAPDQGSSSSLTASAAGDPQEHLERARAHILPTDSAAFPSPYSSSPYRPSHLRTLSNASSTTSSIEESAPGSLKSDVRGQGSSFDVSPNASGVNIPSAGSAQDTYISGTPPGGGAGMEPMFNFRSLAAMVGHDDKLKDVSHEEDVGEGQASKHQQSGGSSSSNADDEVKGSIAAATNDNSGLRANGTFAKATDASVMDVPSFKFTASSRTNSDFDDTKHAAMRDEHVPRDDIRASP
ncbi:hypothetical protein N7G274_000730 [Stereocaulon virgatum]|uniref:Protein sip5 n=1 Tax=Stereocaulon virgatum TaxID=373712 RepID=A0ABR4ARB3_9LECA